MPSETPALTPRLGAQEIRPAHTCLKSLEELPLKGRVELFGFVQSVSYSAPNSAPKVTAVVVDKLAAASGQRGTVPHVRLQFMGQKQVPGVKPGVQINYAGMVALVDQVPTIFNPRYVIVPVNRR